MDKNLDNYQKRIVDLENANRELQAQLAEARRAHRQTAEELQTMRQERHNLDVHKIEHYPEPLSESLLHLVIDNMPEAAFWKDRNSVYLGCNQHFAKAAGLGSTADVIGKTDFDLPWKPMEADWFRECDRRVMESDTPEVGIIEPQQRADGHQYWLETNKIPLHDAQGQVMGILGTFTDITNRIWAEKQLTQQAIAIAGATDGISIFSDDGFTYLNQAYADLFGYDSPEELLGQSWQIFYDADEIDRMNRDVMPLLRQQGSWQGEAIAKRKDGSTFIQDLSLNITEDGTYICIFRDITQRKQTELALQQLNESLEQRVDERTQELQTSKARLQHLAANLPGLIFQFRLTSDGTRSFPYVSEGCRDIYELEPDNFLQCFDLVHPADRDALEQAIQVSAFMLSGFHHEHRIITPSGKLKWVQAIARPEQKIDDIILWDGLIIEVSDRKRAEKEQQRLLSILETTPDIVGIADAQGNILYFNQAGQTLLDIPPEESARFHVSDFHTPETLEQFRTEAIATALQTGMWQGESWLRSRSGRDFPVSQVILAHRGEDNSVEFLSAVMRDITDVKQAEERLRQQRTQYRQIFETVTDGLGILNLDTGQLLEANPAYSQMHGYSHEEFLALFPDECIHPQSQSNFAQLITEVRAGRTFAGQATGIHRDGHLIELEMKGIPYLYQNQPHALCILRDISQRIQLDAERKRQEQALRAIVEGTAAQTGESFFQACVKHLALALDVRYVLIAEIIREQGQPFAKTLAFWNNSEFGDNFQYNLAGTPCLNIFQTRTICRYANSVQRLFPEDFDLVALNAESYVGIPVLNPNGDFLGFIAVLDTEPMDQALDLQAFTLEIFSARAGAEIERMQVEKALIASTEQVQQQAQREQLLNQVANQIRTSLDLDRILNTTVQEIRSFLGVDRCHFAWYVPCTDGSNSAYWDIIAEVQTPDLPSFIGQHDAAHFGMLTDRLLHQQILQIDDVEAVEDIDAKAALMAVGNKSMLVLPIRAESGKVGMIACIHSQGIRPWTTDEIELLKAVVAQLEIALNQADLLAQSQARAQELEVLLTQLQRTQSRLVQSEKMSSLGQMVAGVAHEINNPVSFIYGNLTHAKDYTQNLVRLIELYQHHYPQPPSDICATIEEIELDFLKLDFPKLFQSMEVGTDRIREIIKSLRTFSRLDEAEIKKVNLHDGINSSLTILQTRLRAQHWRPKIQVLKEYGELPEIECYAGQLNQVFMNLLSNAVDALEERDQNRSLQQMEREPSFIRIRTQLLKGSDRSSGRSSSRSLVAIAITDNGPGISQYALEHLFNPFFTTKPVGKGTGLGLSISYQVITETHGGTITCHSELGQGTTFTINLPIQQL